MTLQEIKELVSKKIAGQGSQVDIGGALAEILNGIIDIAGAGLQALEITETPDSAEGVRISADRFNEIKGAIALSHDNHLYLRSSSPTLAKAIFDDIGEFDGDGLAFVDNLLLDGTNAPISYSAYVICSNGEHFTLFFREV